MPLYKIDMLEPIVKRFEDDEILGIAEFQLNYTRYFFN